jgi:glycerophosphoryl diester phosphodiesterase
VDLTAHRGFAGVHPENTLLAVRESAPVADWVEVDVRRCGSGEPVVIHDATVDRVTDASGPVADFTADELAGLSVLDSGEGVPTLRAVLDALPADTGLNLELKEPVYDAVELAREHGPERVLVCSFEADWLGAVGERTDLDRAYLAATDPRAAVSTAATLDCVAVHPRHSLVDTELVERARDHGLAVRGWTVERRSAADRLRGAGADGVVADLPDVL